MIYGKVRIDPTAGAFTASPWAYNGRIFALSEDGVSFVTQAGPEYVLLGKNSLDEMTLATPRDCPRKPLHRDRFMTVSYPPAQGD
jgi:outer membrane protein assembly factor BamB